MSHAISDDASLSTTADTQPNDALLGALQDAFSQGALPGENDGFNDDASREAAQFALTTMMHRERAKPAIAIDTAAGADGRRTMRMAVINRDMPFLVDSIANEVSAAGLDVYRIIHPVLSVRRDDDGKLTEIMPRDASGERQESIVYIEMERADAKVRRQLHDAVEQMLADVRATVQDWPLLQHAMSADAENIADPEGAALLRWFIDRNMTQLAHHIWDLDGSIRDAKGFVRVSSEPVLAEANYRKAVQWFENGGSVPLIVKSNRLSTVHRRVPMDLVILPLRVDGKITGLSVHCGIWTSAALVTAPDKVPLLRAHLKTINDKYGFDSSGHAGKALAHALTSLPHDLLITFRTEDIERAALTFMSLADRPRPKLITIESSLERHLFAFAWLPRDEVSTGRRIAIEKMLNDAANAKTLSWTISLEDGQVAMLRYVLDLRDNGRVPDGEKLDAQLKDMVRGWLPEVENALGDLGDESRAAALASRYAEAFPASYRIECGAKEAATDILRLYALNEQNRRSARLYAVSDDASNGLHLKLYNVRGSIALSEAVPVLEHFGFDVAEEVPTPLADGELGYIHDFTLVAQGMVKPETILERAQLLEEAIANVLDGRAEDDGFNQLITINGLTADDVILLRAWFRYLRQTGMPYGLGTFVDALRDAPQVTSALMVLFRARHDPAFDKDREKAEELAQRAIRSGLTQVSAIDDDRLLRLLRDLILAILRTNAFSSGNNAVLAFKIESAKVPGLPKPLPWREIFVYAPSVEGVHLRAGAVARGGLRWSDRRDDFRTEILGLMKAQRVKNAVIVPTGAKGGFFAKSLPDPARDRDAWAAAGKEAYKKFIRSLLSITDNIVDGEVIHPEGVYVRDGVDPYFVVAADKGTATFSDTANGIAEEAGFWLGDAFASGGSQGYDHKAMGITARGAWVSVQRHFLEMGVDVQSQPVNVIGCGDMSGDVFGNGMLLSKAIKLVAAFDHRNIFIDPDPDPAKSWDERKRLFDLPRSSWEDYDPKLISKGGAVFSRSQKSLTLTPEIQTLLGLDQDEIEPDALITAILKSDSDLLWFGGIGTYIKAAHENNLDVGDPTNDVLRVNAEDLRCKVIGEGANLGITQAGRIAFSLEGGRVNTDFIDNSAGVDCSDNEVNIKIALGQAVRAGALSTEDRNSLLESMTDAVADLVLADNRFQALGLSIAESGGADALPSYIRLIESFEEMGRLDREVEGIADNDTLKRRITDDQGLTRPELAVLLSTAKLSLQDAIEASPIADDPSMEPELLAAFPEAMQQDFADQITGHQLRKELIATKVANRIINRLGIIHPMELAEEEGCSLGHIAIAFVAAERLFDMTNFWEKLDTAVMDEQVRLMLFDRAALALRSQMADIVRQTSATTLPGTIVDQFAVPVAKLFDKVDELLSDEARSQHHDLEEALRSEGAPQELAEMIAGLFKMDGAVGLSQLSLQSGIAPDVVTKAFSNLGSALSLDWVQMTAARMSPTDPWERLLVSGMARDFQQMRRDFLAVADDPVAHVQNWTEANADRITQFRRLVKRAQLSVPPSVSMLAQIANQARMLLKRG
ncbi:MAG: NAD-glutamate dehydrogenase domain-containing protein [Pseudomonadota bacterium]